MKLCVLGAGAWGTALALTASRHHDTVLYARDPHQAALLGAARENQRYLPGIVLPDELAVTGDIDAALAGIDLLVIATPLAGLRPASMLCASRTAAPVVWLCKGFEEDSALLPHEVMRASWATARGAALLGPSFALEVARGQPTALTVASSDAQLAATVVSAFHHGALRVYTSDDLIGVEVGGAIKNVLAIATGICDGLSLGLNARAALITRGLAEMMRFGQALGARPDTLTGLTGLGDLILTCTGALSRNRQVGLALGQGQTLDTTLKQLGHVAEGVRCAQAVVHRARSAGVEMPIATAVCRVLFENLSPRDAVAGLLARAARAEIS